MQITMMSLKSKMYSLNSIDPIMNVMYNFYGINQGISVKKM